jgi:hypothetical protein
MIVANLILPDAVLTNDYLRQRKAMQLKYLAGMNKRFKMPIVHLPLLSDDLMGREQLIQAGSLMYGK